MGVLRNILTIFLLCIFASSAIFAADVDFGDKNSVSATISISNDFTIESTSNSYELKYVNATLTSYPQSDYRQSVHSTSTDPDAVVGDTISFYYDSYRPSYDLKIESDVTVINGFVEVKKKVAFPLNSLDSSLNPYVKSTDIIDINPEIENLASEIIGDKTDLYEIEYYFAEYVRKNIAYDLSSITSNADQKSSWVLEHKRGVCDELTNLFISLNRAAGVPARFVSGVAYTNLDDVFGESWVSHAWAEVYYPGVGWVPYDVTYGQYGFIDAGHIKLSHSAESSSSNINYNYLGSNIKLNPGEIDIDVEVTDFGEDARARYDFVATAHTRDIGFGSYDMISVKVTNDQSYYQVADLYLAETEGLEIIEESKETLLNKTMHRKQVLLKPKESKTVYWIVQVDTTLNENYAYTFPVSVYNTYNDTSTTFIYSRDDYNVIEKEYFDKIIESSEEEQESTYSKYIYLTCAADKNDIYIEDTVKIQCILDNKGDRKFDKVTICVDSNCTNRSLQVEKVQIDYERKFQDEGLNGLVIKAYNDEFIKTSYVSIGVLDKPRLSIKDLSFDQTVGFDQDLNIAFTISKESKSVPRNLVLTLASDTNRAEWTFDELTEDKSFTVKSNGRTLKPKDNTYKIIVNYQDEKGNDYAVDESFTVKSEATFMQNILLYMNVIGYKVSMAFT